VRCRGFTLVELLLVLTILGILAGTAVTMLADDEHELDATARQVAADLLQAQQLAIAHRVPIGLSFANTFPGPTFVLNDGTALANAATPLLSRGGLNDVEVARLVAARPRTAAGTGAITMSVAFGGANQVVFAADGTPSNGGIVSLVRRGIGLRVRLAPVTGRVAITAP
jgi:type II secretion system protein H